MCTYKTTLCIIYTKMAAANESAKSASEAEETNDSRSSSTSSPLVSPIQWSSIEVATYIYTRIL